MTKEELKLLNEINFEIEQIETWLAELDKFAADETTHIKLSRSLSKQESKEKLGYSYDTACKLDRTRSMFVYNTLKEKLEEELKYFKERFEES